MDQVREGGAASKPAAADARSGVSTLQHAIALLKALPSNGASIGVNELARATGMHKSSVSRMLATFEQHQFVQRDSNRHVMLGVGLVALVSPMLGGVNLMRYSKPVLAALAGETGETAILAVWNGHEAVMVEQVIGPQAVVHYAWPGKTVPGHTTAAGKMFLALLPGAYEQASAAGFRQFTEHTVTDSGRIGEILIQCKADGYAVNDQENELESCGVAAPVFDFRGNVVAALSLAIPKHRFNETTRPILIGATVQKAADLSRQLGGSAKR